MTKIRPVEERFWEKVRKTNSCWLWTGVPNKEGYGRFYVNGADVYTHRYSYQLHYGSIPDGLDVLHECDTPACVNPAHLKTGTQTDNMKDKEARGRGNQPKGEQCGQAKVTEAMVQKIHADYAKGLTQKQIASTLPISQVQVSNILNGKAWKNTK